MRIELRYILVGQSSFAIHNLTPEEYYEGGGSGPIGFDCAPRYNHAIDYLDPCLDVRRTELLVTDAESGRWMRTVETFWDDRRSRVVEVSASGDGGRWEIIVDIFSGAETHDIVRYGSVARGEHVLFRHSRISREPGQLAERLDVRYSISADPGVLHAVSGSTETSPTG